MSINKNAMKQFISEQITKQIQASMYDDQIKYLRRLEGICRAAINRLSYELSYDNAGAITLKCADRVRFIESKTNNTELCKRAYLEASEYVKIVKDKYLAQSGEATV